MKILLDTHTFIWWDSEQTKLPATVLHLCQDQTNTLILSVASVWEMQIKHQLGKLTLKLSLAEIIEAQQHTNNYEDSPNSSPSCARIREFACSSSRPF